MLAWKRPLSSHIAGNSAQTVPFSAEKLIRALQGTAKVDPPFPNDLIGEGENSHECNSIMRDNVIKGRCLPAVNEIVNSFQHAIGKHFLSEFKHALCDNN